MQSIAWWPTIIVVVIATNTDLHSRRIPNWLVLPFLAMGLVVAPVVGGWAGLGQSLAGMMLATLIAGVFCSVRALGVGDLKLLAAVGAWIGPSQLMMALVVTGMAGGFLAVGWAVCRGMLGQSLDGAGDLIFGAWRRGMRPHPTLVLSDPSRLKIPYAPAIAIGTIFSFFTLNG